MNVFVRFLSTCAIPSIKNASGRALISTFSGFDLASKSRGAVLLTNARLGFIFYRRRTPRLL